MRSAALFQVIIVPLRSLLIIASSVESTIAANRLLAGLGWVSESCFFTYISSCANIRKEPGITSSACLPRHRTWNGSKSWGHELWGEDPIGVVTGRPTRSVKLPRGDSFPPTEYGN